MTKYTPSELESNRRGMTEAMKDDEDFLKSFGSTRTRIPSDLYKRNFDAIFRRDRVNAVEAITPVTPN
jgi:tellurite resistance protein